MKFLRRSLAWLLLWIARQGQRILADKTVIRGIPLYLFTIEGDHHPALEHAVRTGIDTLDQYSPRHVRRLRRYVRRLAVRNHPGVRGQFDPADSTIVLARDFLLTPATTAVDIASLLVHETTHARISAAGIPYSELLRVRIERLCTRAELDFARSLPAEQSSNLILRLEAKNREPDSVWTDAEMLRRDDLALGQIGASGTLRKFMRWLRAADRAV